MRKVGIKTLKNKLSEYVRAAAAGETILVTDRDRVVAQMSPPPPAAERLSPEEWWAEQVRNGTITPATNPRSGPPPRLPPVMTFDELMKELDADREDRF